MLRGTLECSGEEEMLLIRDSITREVVAVGSETTAAEALALCRVNRIRHLPVIKEGRLVDIISDRDLCLATPALGDSARSEALGRLRVADEMVRDVATVHPEEPVEDAAMYEKIGCLPVVDREDLAGILTSSDMLRAFARLVGADEPGSRIEVSLPNRSGSLAEVVGFVSDKGVNFVSVLASSEREDEDGERVAVLRLATINSKEVVEDLKVSGYWIRWPPAAPELGRA